MQDAGLYGADWKLVFALRIAALILRSRTDARLPFLRVAADAGGFAIDLPQSLAGRERALRRRARFGDRCLGNPSA